MKNNESKKQNTAYICSRLWKPGMIFYVRELLNESGVDWGYTDERKKARPISAYWTRRFIADMRRVNAIGVTCIESSSIG
jgi:hypothetical protein